MGHSCLDNLAPFESLKKAVIDTSCVSVFQIQLGRRLRVARKAAEMTLQQAATAIGVSASTVSRMEDGSTSPYVPQLYALSRLYGRQFSELAVGSEPEHIDISELWPDTQNIIRRHVEYLLVSQQMVEDNWSEKVGKMKSGIWDADPPWNF